MIKGIGLPYTLWCPTCMQNKTQGYTDSLDDDNRIRCCICTTKLLVKEMSKGMPKFESNLHIKLDNVNHPSHYGGVGPYECIKVIEAWGLGFCLGNVVKYVYRADKKGSQIEDLKKAKWYLEREIERLESATKQP